MNVSRPSSHMSVPPRGLHCLPHLSTCWCHSRQTLILPPFTEGFFGQSLLGQVLYEVQREGLKSQQIWEMLLLAPRRGCLGQKEEEVGDSQAVAAGERMQGELSCTSHQRGRGAAPAPPGLPEAFLSDSSHFTGSCTAWVYSPISFPSL